MKKTPTLFKRDHAGNRLVYDEVTPGCEWVTRGEGVATRKYDGTSCLVEDGRLYKRHEVKKGKKRPDGFMPADVVDPVTGKQPGWVAVTDDPADKWHREAGRYHGLLPDGTYELIGPKVQGNPERVSNHYLASHKMSDHYPNCPRTFAAIRHWLKSEDIEGIVWHHPDGRWAKIKKKDFGIPRR